MHYGRVPHPRVGAGLGPAAAKGALWLGVLCIMVGAGLGPAPAKGAAKGTC